jgi:hypothetical protein
MKDNRLKVPDNRVLRRVFGRNGDRTKRHNERPCDYYESPYNIQVIISRKMRWAGHAANRRVKKIHTWFLWRNVNRDRLKELRIFGKTALKWILKVLNWGVWIELIWPWKRTFAFRIIQCFRKVAVNL